MRQRLASVGGGGGYVLNKFNSPFGTISRIGTGEGDTAAQEWGRRWGAFWPRHIHSMVWILRCLHLAFLLPGTSLYRNRARNAIVPQPIYVEKEEATMVVVLAGDVDDGWVPIKARKSEG